MWKGVLKLTVLPLTDWTSMTWPTGRFGRVNQVRETSPGGDFVLHSVMAGLGRWSTTTISPAARPAGTAARVPPRPPFTPVVGGVGGWGGLEPRGAPGVGVGLRAEGLPR